jgi:carboxyl-terminal processing protease
MEERVAVMSTRAARRRWCAALLVATLLVIVPAVADRTDAANASLVAAALRVIEQEYVDPVDPVQMLNAATTVLRTGTHLGTDVLPDIRPGTPRTRAMAEFSAEFSRAARTGVAPATDMAYAATAGMLASLHDSHTYFLDPAALREGRKQLSGHPSFSGIGVGIISGEDAAGVRWIFIDQVFPGSPAMKAGLRRFDKIVDAGGKSLRNVSALDASETLRGPAGSTVPITVVRAGKQLKISIVRAPIAVPPVEASFLKPGVAYLKVFEFSRGAGSAARKALDTLAAAGPIRSVVLDLRGNPGGLIVEAADVGSLFLPSRTTLARLIERGKPADLLMTAGDPVFPRVPMAVLVNGGSASGSEIVAGALRDNQRAPIVGEKTAGALAGSVIVPLPEGGMSVTVERILLPKSARVEGIGIPPTVAVGLTGAAMERGEDSQLEAAVRIVESTQKARLNPGARPAAHPVR